MDLKEYLGRYEALQESIRADERLLELVEASQSSLLLSRIREGGSFSQQGKSSLSQIIFDASALRRRLAHKNRLYEKYAMRIKAAAELISSPTLRSFVICRYLYGFKADQIAEINYYSERHIYRKAQNARRELHRALLLLMPRRKEERQAHRYRIVKGREGVKKYIRPGMIPRPVRLLKKA